MYINIIQHILIYLLLNNGEIIPTSSHHLIFTFPRQKLIHLPAFHGKYVPFRCVNLRGGADMGIWVGREWVGSLIILLILLMMRVITRGSIRFEMAIEKKLFVYDAGVRDGTMDYSKPQLYSGIRATIFGASGNLGRPIAAELGLANSSLIMPLSLDHNFRHSEHLKDLRVTGPTNRTWIDWSMNYRDHAQIERMVQNSNVVVNLLGPRHKLKKREDFEFINIEVAERIAKACAKHGVHRLIHFSAAGADPNSPSLDFQTKYEAEQVVRKAFPNVTIMRPCPVFGLNDNFASIVRGQLNFFWNKFVIVYDDSTTKKQPIKENDVAKAVLNALKLEETKGKTYELGGPHVLSMLEVYEIMFNIMRVRPKIAYLNPEPLKVVGKYIYNWPHFSLEMLRKRQIEEVVKEGHGTIQDLLVDPVSFKSGIFELLREYIAYYRELDEDYDG